MVDQKQTQTKVTPANHVVQVRPPARGHLMANSWLAQSRPSADDGDSAYGLPTQERTDHSQFVDRVNLPIAAVPSPAALRAR